MTGVSVQAEVHVRNVELNVELSDGRVTAVVGSNGTGKSTLVQLISGMVRPNRGRILINGAPVVDQQRFLPPHLRNIGVLAQRSLLFPHLRVIDNVAFGVRARGASRHQARARAEAELAAVGLPELAGRWPDELSGGQAQRIGLARALATDPDVLLLDEPLAALDVAAASHMRVLLAERLAGRTAVLVTHDPLDVWMLADEVVVLDAGRVVDQGPTEQVFGAPVNSFVADLAGLNRLVGTATRDGLCLDDGTNVVGVVDAYTAPVLGQPALALFEPAAVSIHLDLPGGSPRNVWPVEVVALEPRGSLVRVFAVMTNGQRLSADITASSVRALELAAGNPVFMAVKAAQVRVVPN